MDIYAQGRHKMQYFAWRGELGPCINWRMIKNSLSMSLRYLQKTPCIILENGPICLRLSNHGLQLSLPVWLCPHVSDPTWDPPPCAARQSKSDLHWSIFTPKFLPSEVRRRPTAWLTRPTTTSITTQQTINKWTQRYREILYKRSNLTPESSDIRSESPFSHHSLRLLQPHFES